MNLSICHTFTGVEADGLRSELNTFGATEVKDAFKEMMLKRFPDAKRIDTIEISDDLESNTIKINDSYRMAAEQFPQSGGGQYHFPIHLITDNIPTTEEARLYPLALRFPRDVIHEISVDVPYAFDSPQSGEKVSSGPGFEFEHLTESRSGGIIFRCRYRTT
ncbi:MAG: hypothetical protein R3F19_21070 [Verrucomicrobiales bacterium]